MGPPIKVLLELEILMGELAYHSLHVQDAVVGSLVGCISYWRRVDWVSDDNKNVSVVTFGRFGVSATSSHDEQELGRVFRVFGVLRFEFPTDGTKC